MQLQVIWILIKKNGQIKDIQPQYMFINIYIKKY